jgi:hypothetical protein
MKTRMLQLLIVAFIAVISFAGGWLGREYRLLDGPRFILNQPLVILSTSPSTEGRLPSGTVLYHYRTLPEISTYVAFVNTKRLDALRPLQDTRAFLVDPIEVQ